ncbi:nuclear transport factor 2 family protein, partial [Salmonella enterica subsp. enterica serovar Heidelberg]|nr:nuclear transport factor 2 family protein [Salmonella enterica subsp. enterica serovar Heidelberg]
VVATSGAAFVALYAKQCEARKAPGAWRSRRALLPVSLRVDPVPGYGAIEEGDHFFYERRGDGPEKLVGRAHFVQLWKKAPDGWRVARILSYAHQAV